MEDRVNIYLTADNIISALGFTTRENFEAVRAYRSGVSLQTDGRISGQPMQAATIDPDELRSRVRQRRLEGYTRLEQLFILSISDAIAQCPSATDLSSPDSCLIFSSTKGNIDLLEQQPGEESAETVSLSEMAGRVAAYFQAGNRFRVISNACISGVSALIVAQRMMETEGYKKAIVTGGDLLSRFITSGFAAFKSVSPEVCRPFDAARNGLNLGEGCGTLLLTTEETPGCVRLAGGGISNDANHISGPSRTGDGLCLAIQQAMNEAGMQPADIGFVNTHGTATVYNDEMESKAIHLAGLPNVPLNSLKPYFGHTLGAAGVIETIICARQLKEGIVLGTPGFQTSGVPMPVKVRSAHSRIPVQACVKTASGFGGCNAAVVLALPARDRSQALRADGNGTEKTIRAIASVTIRESRITVNGQPVFASQEQEFPAFIREAYKTLNEGNMKFYKMDDLCKLGYMAAHYLLQGIPPCPPAAAGIVLGNANASLHTDIRHQQLINDKGDEAASPAVFVYTLPNVVAGEICIRHQIQGENTFFIYNGRNPDELRKYARVAMRKGNLTYCVAGWCELVNERYEAWFELLESQPDRPVNQSSRNNQ